MNATSRNALGRRLRMARGLYWGFGVNGDPYSMLLCGHDDEPSRWYARIGEHGGVWQSRTGTWVVTDHALAGNVLDDALFTRAEVRAPEWMRAAGCVTTDWAGPFSSAWAENIAGARPDEQTLFHTCGRLVDDLDTRFDLVEDFAREVPVTAIASLFGMDDTSTRMIRDLARSCAPVLDAQFAPQTLAATEESIAALHAISDLPDGDKIRPLVALAAEMTANTIVNVVLAAIRDPELSRRSTDPDSAASVVEEVLRLAPAAHLERRCAAQDVELGGVEIAEGSEVVVVVGAANRDARTFRRPGEFDLDRPVDEVALSARGRADGIDEFTKVSAATALQAIAPVVDRLSIGSMVLRRRSPNARGFSRVAVEIRGI